MSPFETVDLELLRGRKMLQKIALRFAFVLALLMPLAASASESDVPYSPQAVKDALAEGRAVLLDFAADW